MKREIKKFVKELRLGLLNLGGPTGDEYTDNLKAYLFSYIMNDIDLLEQIIETI